MSNTQSLIEQLYQEEQQRIADEATFSPLDMSVSAPDMAMLTTIAKRFGKDKSLFAREALGQALVDMFSALEPAERKMLAREADELAGSIAAEIAEEQGLAELNLAGTNWVAQDKACVREEKKAEKERAKKQEKAQAMTNETTMSEAAAEQNEEADEADYQANDVTAETPADTLSAEPANDQVSDADDTDNQEQNLAESEQTEAPASIFGTN